MAVILHVDMDAFFASVEQLHHPEWRGRPLVVGAGPHERGVVSTCSYEARRFGVRSAMPSRTAYQLCPQAVFVPPHMELYQEASRQAFEVFGHYSPYVEEVSIDEAFLDVTGTLHLHGGSMTRLGEALRREIRERCGVTCSVGLAPNRLLAKIGSEQRKPDGLTVMPFDRADIVSFLAPRPIGILWGIGKRTEEALRPYGITTCGDLQRLDPSRLTGLRDLPEVERLVALANGISEEFVYWEPAEEKSVSREHTFDTDETRREAVRAKLLELVTDVGRRLRGKPRWAQTARLKLRDATFRTITRQRPFAAPSRDDLSLREAALRLFDAACEGHPAPNGPHCTPVRLIGFGVANLCPTPDGDSPPSLFPSASDERRQRNERLSETLDALHRRGLM